MSGNDYGTYLETAVSAARSGGEVIIRNLGSLSREDIRNKKTADFVTRVDRDSEEIIITTIRKRFHDHSFLAEESGKGDRVSEFQWIIDPLDGTTNFIHSFPVFCVSIALQRRDDLIVAAVLDPTRDELFTATRGKGASLNGAPLRVSESGNFEDSLLTTGFPFRQKEYIDAYLRLFKNLFSRTGDLRRAGSAALDLAYLAAGRCDGFFEIGLSPWDIAAGSLLIEEAGGIVTDFGGGRDHLISGNIVAGTPATHEKILDEVKKVFTGIIDR